MNDKFVNKKEMTDENDEDGVEIYEVKSSKGEKDIYLDDIAYQYYIVSNLGFNIKIQHAKNHSHRHGCLLCLCGVT